MADPEGGWGETPFLFDSSISHLPRWEVLPEHFRENPDGSLTYDPGATR